MSSTADSLSDRVLSQVVHRTKADAAYDELRSLIISGRLRPSEALKQEELAAALGVSTTPLREAIRRLESDGLVITAANRGVFVAPLDLDHIAELFETRVGLEVFAASLAAERRTDEDIAAMKAALKRSRMSVRGKREADEAWAANRQMHETIARASHNEVLIDLLEALWDRYERCRPLFDVVILDPVTEREHETVAKAIEHRRPDAATAAFEKHLASGYRVLAEERTRRI